MAEPLLRITIFGAKVVSECAPNSRVYWATRHSATITAHTQAKIACKDALQHAGIDVVEPPIVLTCTRFYAGQSKPFDEDALGSTFKPAVDGIKTALGFDDAPRFMTIVCKQEKAPTHRLEFTIEKREATE